nr:MAG TPA: hypothetical protein [Caudoviricetes sp.]
MLTVKVTKVMPGTMLFIMSTPFLHIPIPSNSTKS